SDLAAARTLLWVGAQATIMLRAKGRTDEARRLCEPAIPFGKARVREHPRDVEMRMHLAFLEYCFGIIEKTRGRPLEALKILRGAADTFGVLARENPPLTRARYLWGYVLNDVSQSQSDLGQYAEAEQSARAAIDLFEVLVREVPSSYDYRRMAGLS